MIFMELLSCDGQQQSQSHDDQVTSSPMLMKVLRRHRQLHSGTQPLPLPLLLPHIFPGAQKPTGTHEFHMWTRPQYLGILWFPAHSKVVSTAVYWLRQKESTHTRRLTRCILVLSGIVSVNDSPVLDTRFTTKCAFFPGLNLMTINKLLATVDVVNVVYTLS